MALLELSFESNESSLAVRHFEVREELNGLFTVSIRAGSPRPDVDVAAIIGKPASFRLASGLEHATLGGSRRWTGICDYMEQIHALPEGQGESTYALRVVPSLWALGQRRNCRIFQRESVPAIVRRLLAEWKIEASWRIDEARYPPLEYRVQYGESDLDFARRLLEEAGIAFTLVGGPRGSSFTFSDAPHLDAPRPSIPFRDNPTEAAEREFLTEVRIAHEMRPGKITIRDYDFRNPGYPLFGAAQRAQGIEGLFEQYHYEPGAFLVVGGEGGATPSADDKAVARHDEGAGNGLAARRLQGAQASRRSVRFRTNVVDLHPGAVFTIDDHPGPELDGRPLLLLELEIRGTPGEAWSTTGLAIFAGRDNAYVPPLRTPKPRVNGVQSAVVVGPAGDEIHTDEFGRVRVQFHWDREGKLDDNSSCWMRVSHGSAGGSFGMIVLPRVGQEVLVGFLEGDPDQPVVVGRVFNSTSPVPYGLPGNKTVSAWKGDSSPGSGGYNEIRFEDAKGREVLSIQAEKDAQKLVKNDESVTIGRDRKKIVERDEEITVGNDRTKVVKKSEHQTIGHDLTKMVGRSEREVTGLNRKVMVGVNRSTHVGRIDSTVVGSTYSVMVMKPGEGDPAATSITMEDQKITHATDKANLKLDAGTYTITVEKLVVTTGGATFTMEGDTISITANRFTLETASHFDLTSKQTGAVVSDGSLGIQAEKNVLLSGGKTVIVQCEAGDLTLRGGPMVKINP